MNTEKNVADIVLLTMPCKCGGRAEITENPWNLPWIWMFDQRGHGGAVNASCPLCGRTTKKRYWCGWPTATGNIYTRADAIIDALKDINH